MASKRLSNRDNFSSDVIKVLSARAGHRCSNPDCRRQTTGPKMDESGVINLGEAAHITAAAPNGPRYDPNLSSDERKSIKNAIWLCSVCNKLIDSDTQRYTVALIRDWKMVAEETSRRAIQSGQSIDTYRERDIEIIKFFRKCFDRNAFRVRFIREGSGEDMRKAIEDTIAAINTGFLYSRDGKLLGTGEGKGELSNNNWYQIVDELVANLTEVNLKYTRAFEAGRISSSQSLDGQEFRIVDDGELSEWIDQMRIKVIERFSDLCKDAGLRPLGSIQ